MVGHLDIIAVSTLLISTGLRLDDLVSLSVCLLADDTTDRVVRRLWQRLEDAGVPTLLSHTHARHVPHLTLASLTSYDLTAVRTAVSDLPRDEPFVTQVNGLGIFPRGRAWLAPTVTTGLLQRLMPAR
jgi:hypothetical protein